MADLHSPHDNTDIRINSKIQFIHSPVILSVTAPMMGLVVIIVGIWMVTSHDKLAVASAVIVYGCLGMIGLAGLCGICAVFVKFVVIPIIHAWQRLVEATGQSKRNKLIHIQDNAAVIENAKGEVEVVPLLTMQQKDIHYHKNDLLQLPEGKEDEPPIPSNVEYDAIKYSIPRGHALVGIGAGGRIISSDDSIRALTWIVGSTGAGKTNSVVLRIQDMYDLKHQFLVIDPHYHKEDSLARAVTPYKDRFLMPIAYKQQDILAMLNAFLDMGRHRMNTPPPYTPYTIVIDEVGSLSSVIDKDDALRVEIKDKIKEVGRFCGQEGRGFVMRAIFISQNGTYLAWLRQNASLAIVHQIQDWDSRILATNKNTTIARDMDTWPKGRTYCYGIDFDPVVVQQPRVTPRNTPPTLNANNDDEMEPLPIKNVPSKLSNGRNAEGNGEVTGSDFLEKNPQAQKVFLANLGKRLKDGESKHSILQSMEFSGGRPYQDAKSVLDLIEDEEGL